MRLHDAVYNTTLGLTVKILLMTLLPFLKESKRMMMTCSLTLECISCAFNSANCEVGGSMFPLLLRPAPAPCTRPRMTTYQQISHCPT
jgi:hypothetical protein